MTEEPYKGPPVYTAHGIKYPVPDPLTAEERREPGHIRNVMQMALLTLDALESVLRVEREAPLLALSVSDEAKAAKEALGRLHAALIDEYGDRRGAE